MGDRAQGEQLLVTWQRAGHTEDSLRRLLHQEQPQTQSSLQLLLVKVRTAFTPSFILPDLI